jgi:hypothetical protein
MLQGKSANFEKRDHAKYFRDVVCEERNILVDLENVGEKPE